MNSLLQLTNQNQWTSGDESRLFSPRDACVWAKRMCLNHKVYGHWPTCVCRSCVWWKMLFTFFLPDSHVMKIFPYWNAQKRWLDWNTLPSVPSGLGRLLFSCIGLLIWTANQSSLHLWTLAQVKISYINSIYSCCLHKTCCVIQPWILQNACPCSKDFK